MARAHDESSIKGKRVSEAWKNKKSLARTENKPLGRACPYWLELKDGEYLPIPERVKAVNLIFQLCVDGHGQNAISKMLNQRGIPIFGSTVRNRSGAWGVSSIGKIINNRALIGEYQPTHLVDGKRVNDGDPVKGFFPQVVSGDLFYQAHAARSQRRIYKATKQSSNFNVWQGIAKCADCGDAMHLVNKGKPPKGYTYLQCHSARKGVCKNKMIRLERAGVLFRELLAKVDSMSLVQESSGELSKKLDAVEGRLADVTSRLDSAKKSMLEFPTASTAEILQIMDRDKEALSLEAEQLREQLASDQVVSKEDFFKRLDLVSYEGRAAANRLIKRLGPE